MRFSPWKCPECGQAAHGTQETVPGLALLLFDEEGNAQYEGGTEMDWNDQATQVDAVGRVILECPDGHQWKADAEWH